MIKKENTSGKPIKEKAKPETRYIVSHEYKGNLSMQTAFQEVIENRVCNQFEQWKDQKPS